MVNGRNNPGQTVLTMRMIPMSPIRGFEATWAVSPLVYLGSSTNITIPDRCRYLGSILDTTADQLLRSGACYNLRGPAGG